MNKQETIDLGFDLQNKCAGALLGEDEYLLRVVGFKEMETKDKKGRLFIVEFLVEEGELKGSEHAEFYAIDTKMGAQSFADLFFSLHPKLKGQEPIESFNFEEDFENCLVMANIGHEDYNGTTTARVKNEGFSPYMPKKKKRKPADDDEADETPRKKRNKRSAKDMDDDEADEKPKKSSARKRKQDDDDEDEKPKKGKDKKPAEDDDGDDAEYD